MSKATGASLQTSCNDLNPGVLGACALALPAVLGAIGNGVNAVSLPWAKRQQHRSPVFARWGELLHRHPWPFAKAGQCEENKPFMYRVCPASCGICTELDKDEL